MFKQSEKTRGFVSIIIANEAQQLDKDEGKNKRRKVDFCSEEEQQEKNRQVSEREERKAQLESLQEIERKSIKSFARKTASAASSR